MWIASHMCMCVDSLGVGIGVPYAVTMGGAERCQAMSQVQFPTSSSIIHFVDLTERYRHQWGRDGEQGLGPRMEMLARKR